MLLRIDHLVLTVNSLERTCEFYTRVLKCVRRDVPGKPTSLHFGACKINVHEGNHTFEPKARIPTSGSADFCVITEVSTNDLLAHLAAEGVATESGPIARMGALGLMVSVYFRDPDSNLIEVSKYDAFPFNP